MFVDTSLPPLSTARRIALYPCRIRTQTNLVTVYLSIINISCYLPIEQPGDGGALSIYTLEYLHTPSIYHWYVIYYIHMYILAFLTNSLAFWMIQLFSSTPSPVHAFGYISRIGCSTPEGSPPNFIVLFFGKKQMHFATSLTISHLLRGELAANVADESRLTGALPAEDQDRRCAHTFILCIRVDSKDTTTKRTSL